MSRSNWVGAPEQFKLNQACRTLVDAFGWHTYQVGSSLEKREFRDVDVRCILPDDEFDQLFPGINSNHQLDARWSLFCVSISTWLQSITGLPIDFQFQRNTEANKLYSGKRSALGIFVQQKGNL